MLNSKKQMKAYLERWNRVNDFELKELRNTTQSQKFRQFESLMSSAHLFEAGAPEMRKIRMVQKRWQQLRKGWRRAA